MIIVLSVVDSDRMFYCDWRIKSMSTNDLFKEKRFILKSSYQPSGDQPEAIARLVEGLNSQ